MFSTVKFIHKIDSKQYLHFYTYLLPSTETLMAALLMSPSSNSTSSFALLSRRHLLGLGSVDLKTNHNNVKSDYIDSKCSP